MSKSISLFAWLRGRQPSLCFLLLLVLAGCGSAGNGRRQAATATSTGQGAPFVVVQQPTAAPSPVASATSTSTVHPPSGLTSGMLPPGSALPSEAQCAARVKRAPFEPRPQNAQANRSVPTAQQVASLSPWDENLGQSPLADKLRKQMSGNFTGTTDEILQWTACKWGVDPDIVRAEAVVESYWKQSQQGDYTSDQTLCPPGTWDGKGCYQSYGILQLKYFYFKSTWPMSRTDTAFNAEYVYGIIRACYEGWTTYLNDSTPLPGYPRYHVGDLWGCLGRWYSGTWYNQGAVDYIQQVKQALANKTWLQAGF